MTVAEYVHTKWNDARYSSCFSVQGYKSLLEKIPNLKEDLGQVLKKNTLSREKVYEEREPYKRFLAAMVWGGISMAPGRNERRSNAEVALSTAKENVEEKLAIVRAQLKDGKELEAFDYLYEGDGKIDRIGVSYLTKILYFFSPEKETESLIFDKWGRFMHAALLIDDAPTLIGQYYSFIHRDGFKSELRSRKPEREMYQDYLKRMRTLRAKFPNIESTGHLEAFLFGDKLYKNMQNEENPRFFLYKKVKSFFAPGEVSKKPHKAQKKELGGHSAPVWEKMYDDLIPEIEGYGLKLFEEPVYKGRTVHVGCILSIDNREYLLYIGNGPGKYLFCSIISYPNEVEMEESVYNCFREVLQDGKTRTKSYCYTKCGNDGKWDYRKAVETFKQTLRVYQKMITNRGR